MIARTTSSLLAAFAASVAVIAPVAAAPGGSPPAKAAPGGAAPAPSPDADSRAKAAAHFKQGQAFFQRGDYDRALAEYQAAFELSAEPLLVFNIALCHDRANRPEQALADFQRYLAQAPNGPVADEARDDVARLTPIVDKLVADREAARAAEVKPPPDVTATRQVVPPRPPAQPSRVPRYVMVAGGVAVLIGATAHVLAWRTRDRLVSASDPDAYFSDRDTLGLERGVAIGGYAVGAATIATGLVLGLVMRPRGGLEVSVSPTSGGAAVAVGWSR
jgi:tetratricopeptide (TPR) repeat protein